METALTVAIETRAQMEKLSDAALCKILKGYGAIFKGLDREQLIEQIVYFEVYAFTH